MSFLINNQKSFNVSLLSTPALIKEKSQNKNTNLTYEGLLRNELDLSCIGQPPFPMDFKFRLVLNKENNIPESFFLRGENEKIKLTYKPDGLPNIIFHSVGEKNGTIENKTKKVIRGKVHQKHSEYVGKYQYCSPFQYKLFLPSTNQKLWVDTETLKTYMDAVSRDNMGIQLLGVQSFVDIALEGAKLCLKDILEKKS